MAILKNLKQEQEELERLRAENAALKLANSKPFRMKVSEKGAVSVYGLGRFPVTLYSGQWETLLSHSDDILRFMLENASQLSTKD
jgi:hypothetical protein